MSNEFGINEDVFWMCEGSDLVKIERVIKRLYDGKTLSYDERRDLARILESTHFEESPWPIELQEIKLPFPSVSVADNPKFSVCGKFKNMGGILSWHIDKETV